MKEELASRTAAVIQLVRDCQQLQQDLRMEPEKDGSLVDRQIAGSLVRSKDGTFMMASKFATDACIGISAKSVEQLTKRVAELHGEKRDRKLKLNEMGVEISALWDKLRVSEAEQLAFAESVQGLALDTIEKGKAEIRRLHTLKANMLGVLIDEARQSISELWNEINAPQHHRREFAPFYIREEEQFNDDLLEMHEKYILALESKLENMKPMLRQIERREVIVRERMEYEDLQKDSERLKQRGAAMAKQLLEEEKMARRIKRELPRLTEGLIEKLVEWKKTHGEDFQYNGKVYLETIKDQEEEWNSYKASEMERKQKKKMEEIAAVENRLYSAPVQGVGAAVAPLKNRDFAKIGNRPLAESRFVNENRDHSRARGGRDVGNQGFQMERRDVSRGRAEHDNIGKPGFQAARDVSRGRAERDAVGKPGFRRDISRGRTDHDIVTNHQHRINHYAAPAIRP
jgi:Microtubule associated protein (MAP65/ASE1 family)